MNGESTSGTSDAGAGRERQPGERHELDPTALSVLATTLSGGLGSPGIEPDETARTRPWSLAAAMEPVPPLAPPPALPGEGVSLVPPPRPAPGGPPGVRGLISIAVLVAAIAVIVILVLVLGR